MPLFGLLHVACREFDLLGRVSSHVVTLEDPRVDDPVFADGADRFHPVPRVGIFLRLFVEEQIPRRNDKCCGKQADCCGADPETSPPPSLRSAPAAVDSGIPSHEEQRRQQQQQVGRAEREPQAAADRRQVVDHQVGGQRHECSVIAVVPDVGEQVERHDGDPRKEPPLFPQTPCGKGQQHGVRQPVNL